MRPNESGQPIRSIREPRDSPVTRQANNATRFGPVIGCHVRSLPPSSWGVEEETDFVGLARLPSRVNTQYRSRPRLDRTVTGGRTVRSGRDGLDPNEVGGACNHRRSVGSACCASPGRRMDSTAWPNGYWRTGQPRINPESEAIKRGCHAARAADRRYRVVCILQPCPSRPEGHLWSA